MVSGFLSVQRKTLMSCSYNFQVIDSVVKLKQSLCLQGTWGNTKLALTVLYLHIKTLVHPNAFDNSDR
ncbi:hypothetical protein EG68_02810 [Paragonimus skrjabini miyazakii]|uniref:Uncharacterized protein n=1 Tax=Paragonimus skrjabini miyazakii TaxID=59628 RepID=A0A8S9YZD4_9TREM|nr:hypothetical protein EG68_02810 [Paragonimus skrjabini miyazakii]